MNREIKYCKNCGKQIKSEHLTVEIEGVISDDVVDLDYQVYIHFCDENCEEWFNQNN